MSVQADDLESLKLYAGKCFLIPSGDSGDHLFFTVFDVRIVNKKERVLLAPLCSVDKAGKHDTTCIVTEGEHQFIRHDSYINYSLLRVETAQSVLEKLASSYFKPQADCNSALLKRIADGAQESRRTPRHVKEDWLV